MIDSARKDFSNPYAKQGVINMNSFRNTSGNKKQPNSCTVSNHKGSKPGSGQRSPMRQTMNQNFARLQQRALSRKTRDTKSNKKKRNMSGSIESADDPEINPVYIDTGGSSMQ